MVAFFQAAKQPINKRPANYNIMKAYSGIVAIVMVLFVSITLVAFGYLLFREVDNNIESENKQIEIKDQAVLSKRDFEIEGVVENQVFIRSVSGVPLRTDDFSFFVDNEEVDFEVQESLEPDKVAVFNLDDVSDSRNLKVTMGDQVAYYPIATGTSEAQPPPTTIVTTTPVLPETTTTFPVIITSTTPSATTSTMSTTLPRTTTSTLRITTTTTFKEIITPITSSTTTLPRITSTTISSTTSSLPTTKTTQTTTTIRGTTNAQTTAASTTILSGPCPESTSFCANPDSVSCGQTISGCIAASDEKFYLVPGSAGRNVDVTLTHSGSGCDMNDLNIRKSNSCSTTVGQSINEFTETWSGTPSEDIVIEVESDSSNDQCQWILNVECDGAAGGGGSSTTTVPRATTTTTTTTIPAGGGGGPNSDLDVTYIERTPRYNYDASKGWPAAGDIVTFIAHVKNAGSDSTGSFQYKWFIDGTEAQSGSMNSLNPGQSATTSYQWTWQNGNHNVKFVADPGNQITEKSEINNQIEDRTNALAVGLWVEQSLYDWYNANQLSMCASKGCAGSNSWEDWAQRQIKEWNRLFQISTYPSAPQGVLDRVRLDKIVIVPDGSLPLNGGLPSNTPDTRDKTVDMMWGFPSSGLNDPEFQNSVVKYDYGLLHEMSHARYLVDLYSFDVQQSEVLVRNNGNLVAGTSLMPTIHFDVVYYNKGQKIMGAGSYSAGYDEHSVKALNRILGQRAKGGNFNAPSSMGEYLNDIPADNNLRILNRNGNPLAGAEIKIYKSKFVSNYYNIEFRNSPDMTGFTNSQGIFNLGAFPFTGARINPYEANGIFLAEIRSENNVEYHFQEVTDFNLAYWAGNTQTATYTINTNF